MSARWLGTGFWHGPTVIGKYQSRPEREQAVFRSTLGVVAFLAYWCYAAGDMDRRARITLLIIGLYVVFGWVTLIALSVRPALSMRRLTVTTIVDQGIVIGALALGGRAALPLLFVVFWFLVGSGCRYGKRPLMLSCSIPVVGMTGLMMWQPWWIVNREAGVGLLLAVVATSFYMYVLVNKLERWAATDPLTGLLNRSSFEQVVEQARVNEKATDGLSAVLLIDLDGFKEINDKLGHGVGDELLRKFAANLVGACRHGDVIARLGGDEFVIFVRHLRSLDDAQTIANRIHQASYAIDFEGESLVVTASIGICPMEGSTKEKILPVTQLLQRADRAMYRAKSNGRAQTVFSEESEIPVDFTILAH